MAAPAETIISWNVPNWITVLIMVMVGFFIVGSASQAWIKWRAGSAKKAAA